MSKLLIPLLLIVAGAGIVVLLVVPAWQQYLVLKADTNHLADINTEIDTLTQKRDELVNQIARIPKNDLQRLDQVMPSEPQGPEFLLSVQKLAVSYGLKVIKLDLSNSLGSKQKTPEVKPADFTPTGQEEKSSPSYKTLNANLEVSGQYQAFKDFLREAESSVRIIDVQNLTLSPQEKGFDFKMTLAAYYQ
ncbi:MAG: hypothetical protein Q8R30_05515 [bacterium]|nr:hypothetical protein [bacterium]